MQAFIDTDLCFAPNMPTPSHDPACVPRGSPQDPKVYVWHLLLQHAEQVQQLLQQGAVVYICGSPNMARDVERVFEQVLTATGCGAPQEELEKWKKEGRYCVDAWKV